MKDGMTTNMSGYLISVTFLLLELSGIKWNSALLLKQKTYCRGKWHILPIDDLCHNWLMWSTKAYENPNPQQHK